jgi:endonuclease/exonuclease/phosphatase family metal-dependent hydrolase
VAPAGGGLVHPHGGAAAGVLQPAALLRPGPAGRVRQVGSAPFRVATWNIRAAIGPGEPFPAGWWRYVTDERFERIVSTIRALDADVVGLQEVGFYDVHGEVHDQPLELADRTGMHVRYAAVHAYALIEPESGRAVGSATWGNVLLTREPVRHGFATGLPAGADDALVEPGGSGLPLAGVTFAAAPYGTREPRCAVGGTVSLGGADATVISTHLSYAGSRQRADQAEALVDLAADHADPVILLGDFNAPVETTEMAPLRAAFVDAFAAVGIPPGDPARRSCGPLPIDHVFVRGLAVEDCHVVTKAGDASDHLPVVATLRPEVG